ncbi:MAG: ABC transporter substrate-binding protein [Candidatus Bipolaricaulaceae bacterium]
MRVWKWLSVALALAAMSVVPAALAADQVKLVWAEWWDPEWGEDTIDWIISTFEEKHPGVTVEPFFIPHNQYSEKLLTLCQAGDVADIMGMEVLWADAFDRVGVLADLAPLAENASEQFKQQYNPAWFIDWRGRSVMAYIYTISYGVLYNERMFAEEGLEPPTDWEELREVLRAFHDPEAHRWGIALPFAMKSSCHFMLYDFWTRLIQAGGQMVDENGLARFDSPAGVRTLEYYKSLLEEGLVYPGTVRGALAVGEKEFRELFAAEQVPMILSGPFEKGVAQERNPDIQVAFTPPFEDCTGGYLITGSGIAISSQTEHPELAWAFFEHLVSLEVAERMIQEFSQAWANTAALNAPELKDDPILGPYGQMLSDPASQSWTALPRLGELCEVVMAHAQEYFLGEKSAQEALDEAAEEWNEIVRSTG